MVANRRNPRRAFRPCSRIVYNRTYDGFRRAQETAVVVTNVRHSAKVRLYDSEDRVCGYALTNAAGRGVSVSLAYDGSYVTNTIYTMPNGSVFSARLSREAGRRNLVTRRDYIALIIGFGAESLIADIVTGMFILIDNQYNVGDIIEVDGFRGTVTEINVRSTVLTDVGGNIKIINNSDMKNILNRSDNASKSVAEFAIPYETDLEELEKKIPAMMQEIYENNQPLMRTVPEYLGVNKLDDSAVILRFIVDVAESDIYAGSRALNHDLFIKMRKIGIEVPFPQLDLHQK